TSRICTFSLPATVRRSLGECPCTSALGLRTRRYSAASSKLPPSSNVTASARRSLRKRNSVGQGAVMVQYNSVKRDMGVQDDFVPFFIFSLGEGDTFLHRGAARHNAEFGEGTLQLAVLQRLVDAAVERGKNVGRRPRRAIDAEPEIDLVSRQQFRHGRQIGIHRRAFEAGGGECNEAALGDERHRGR